MNSVSRLSNSVDGERVMSALILHTTSLHRQTSHTRIPFRVIFSVVCSEWWSECSRRRIRPLGISVPTHASTCSSPNCEPPTRLVPNMWCPGTRTLRDHNDLRIAAAEGGHNLTHGVGGRAQRAAVGTCASHSSVTHHRTATITVAPTVAVTSPHTHTHQPFTGVPYACALDPRTAPPGSPASGYL